MESLIRRIDRVLVRIPTDCRVGRRTRDELIANFDDALTGKTRAGRGFEQALAETAADFGDPDELERDYYDDYLRSRYRLFGLIDLEEWTVIRICGRLGLVFATLGLLLGWLIPTIASFSSAFGIARIAVNQPRAADAESLREASDIATHTPFPETMTLLTGYGPASTPPTVSVLGILGFVLLIAATILTLRRAHASLTAQALPIGLAVAAVGTFFVWSTTSVQAYADAILEIVHSRDAERFLAAADALDDLGRAALGLFALAIASLGVVFARALSQGLARTVLLRQLASAALFSTVGLLLASHRRLAGVCSDLAADQDSVAPAQIVGSIDSDLMHFVLGVLLVWFGVLRFERGLERALRIEVARSGDRR